MKTHHSSLIIHNSSLSRRGVLLLVVLAILALFALIAVAFVVISGQAQRSAKSIERFEQSIDPPEKLLHQAAMQVFRGPTTNYANGLLDQSSVMQAHSLLEDIYGNESVYGTIQTSLPASGGGFPQLVDVTVSTLFNASGVAFADVTAVTAELASRVGCVLTITGPLPITPGYGQSTRIVAASASSPVVQVVAFPNNAVPPIGTEFTINGVPFSGTGFGYDSDTHDLDLTLNTTDPDPQNWHLSSEAQDATHWPVALLPNLPLSTYATANPPPGYTFGGANEDYDAADFQNMLLAAQVPNNAAPGGIQTLPSLHRPALVRYWADRSATPGQLTADELRQIMLRPIGPVKPLYNESGTLIFQLDTNFTPDHPNFTGSNPRFNPAWDGSLVDLDIDGICDFSWDVDNDGDGVTDSVWVDLGMPARATTDGRLYKPLFAILCVDLDGRLNLNAHGSLPQTDTANYSNPIFPIGGTLAGGVSVRGQGLGPAEINLVPLLGATNSQRLMSGITGSYQGRYGSTDVPGAAAILDTLSMNKWFEYGAGFGYGANFWNFTNANNAGSYGSPPDPFGVGAVGLDLAGRPLYVGMNYGGTNYLGYGSGVVDNPYELNLDPNQTRGLPSSIATVDNPFSPAELERILRPFDRDAPSLPDRLPQLSAATLGDPKTSTLYNLRHSLTTESWDLPCPNVVTPSSLTSTELDLLAPDRRVKHITDLLLARGVPATAWAELLPADLLAGLRMNINRPFGNGLDDAPTNGVVDEPGETDSIYGGAFSYDGSDGALAVNSLEARQLESRYLYVLACLTVDLNSLGVKHFGGDYAEVARFLAQWAVNAVDFKDRDSIMTPFDYDPDFANPSATPAGWNATGGTLPRVWGCERPELLISETLAFHDRRTEDTSSEQAVATEADDHTPALYDNTPPADKDASFDQQFKPQGSLFVELFNPWSIQEPRSGDLYTASDGGVDLTKVSATGNAPVWRMIIVDQIDAGKDPDDPDPTQLPDIERAIYFAGPTDAPALPAGGSVQFQPDDNHAGRIAPIYPGRYAVIGPGKQTDTGESITYLGFDNAENPGNVATSPNETRRIELNPNSNPTTSGQVAVFNNGTTNDLSLVTIKNPTAVVITLPGNQRLSISEPDGGYTNVGPDGTTPYSETTGYVPAWDVPLDTDSSTKNNGRLDNVKVIHLQRLANPLLPYNNTPDDPGYNPYRTIDSMPIDLTAFNGIDTSTDPGVTSFTNDLEFYARQRGKNPLAAGQNLIWSQEKQNASPTANANLSALPIPSDLTTTTFNLKDWPLHHSLGLLNDPYGVPNNAAGYEGDPQQPFPWLTWNNRPYISPMELMQVSWLRSSKLLGKYNMAQGGDDPYTEPSQPFPHLTNLFVSGSGAEDEELHRVFEYLGVPSPFVGTETQANPTAANSAGHNFRPPFNGISTYREPGRINLNTIYSEGVFNGLMNGFTGLSWSDFVQSRRGYSASPLQEDVVLAPDPHSDPTKPLFPTEFGKPFRSFGGAAMTPTLDDTIPDNDILKYDCEIDATLLRAHPTAATQPLFQYDNSAPVDNTDRNPYFRYQGIQRLGNLVTTRSNVYAVWITVGYFEVQSVGGTSPVYPDGYTLGRELGMDTGEIERHRAFYIFDRSIPVGFQRGQDLNVEKAILVDRYIE